MPESCFFRKHSLATTSEGTWHWVPPTIITVTHHRCILSVVLGIDFTTWAVFVVEFLPPLRRRNITIFAVSVLRWDDILTMEGNYLFD